MVSVGKPTVAKLANFPEVIRRHTFELFLINLLSSD